MFQLLVTLQLLADDLGARLRHRLAQDRGQSTAEYALVLLGAATVAVVFIAWAGRSKRIGKLFDAVLDTVIGKV
jgi:hypothetical protein